MSAVPCPLVRLLLAVACAAFSHAAEVPPAAPAPGGLKGAARHAKPTARAASDEPLRTMKTFVLAPELKVDLFAAEPLLADPVAISLDHQGRVFVAQTHRAGSSALDVRDYPALLEDDLASRTIEDRLALAKKHFPGDWSKLGIETETLNVLEDRDKDGQADFSGVYADGFNSPLDGAAGGVLAHGGSVWFGNIPNLWKLDGLDKSGHAEKRTALLGGFGVRFGHSGHDLRGLIMGPDGRLYFSVGDRGMNVKTKEGTTIVLPDEGAVLRCEPDGSHLEIFCRGLRDPRGLAFDKFGNFFTADSGSGQGDRGRLLYLLAGGDYGWRVGWQHHPQDRAHHPWLAEKLWTATAEGQAAWVLPPVANLPDEPAGLAYNPGTGLPQQYDGFFLSGSHNPPEQGRISSWKALPFLSGFLMEQEQVFVGHCQPTDLAFGPDGRVYFSERGEGREASGRGRVFRVYNEIAVRTPEVEEVRGLLTEGLAEKVPVQLVPLLGHKDQRVRLQAQWELTNHPQSAAEFASAAEVAPKDAFDQQLARIHAIWGLGMMARRAELKTPGAAAQILAPLLKFLEDEDPEIRAQAVQVLGENRVAEAFDGLIKTLRGSVERVGLFSALALARLGNKEAVPQLLLVARSNAGDDRLLRYAYVMALAAANDFPALQEAAGHTDPQLRMIALLTMRRLQRPEIAQFLADEDPLLVAEAARAIHDVPIDAARPQLAALLAKPTTDEQLMLRVLNAALGTGTAASAQALADFAAQDGSSETLRSEAVQLLARWPQPPARDRVTGLARTLPARDPAPAVAALRALLEKKDLPEKLRQEITAALAGSKQ